MVGIMGLGIVPEASSMSRPVSDTVSGDTAVAIDTVRFIVGDKWTEHSRSCAFAVATDWPGTSAQVFSGPHPIGTIILPLVGRDTITEATIREYVRAAQVSCHPHSIEYISVEQ